VMPLVSCRPAQPGGRGRENGGSRWEMKQCKHRAADRQATCACLLMSQGPQPATHSLRCAACPAHPPAGPP
jgi:hypothetical protein